MRGVFIGFLTALAVTAVVGSDDLMAGEKLLSMTRTELIAEVTKARNDVDATNIQAAALQRQLTRATGEKAFSEKNREANEKSMKKKEKDASAAKKAAILQKKEKLSDILMEHGATFLALKAAKKFKQKGSTLQKQKVLEAARKGARAGAVGPLKKVARDAAVKAVKAARAQAKKDNIKKKKKIRVLSKKAARVAVNKLLAAQDKLVEKCVQKVTAAAILKFEPEVFLAEHDDEPNNFAAPPMIHLSLDSNDAGDQVEQLQEDVKETKAVEKKAAAQQPAAAAPPTIHLSLGADPTTEKTAKQQQPAAAAPPTIHLSLGADPTTEKTAKQDVNTVVPESN